jgi:hypothetical protein
VAREILTRSSTPVEVSEVGSARESISSSSPIEVEVTRADPLVDRAVPVSEIPTRLVEEFEECDRVERREAVELPVSLVEVEFE